MRASLLPWIGWAFTVAILAFACWRGSQAERLGMLAIFVTAVAVGAFQHIVPEPYRQLSFLVTDFLLAAAFLILAVRYASLWLGLAMIFQGGQFILHFIYVTAEIAYDLRYAVVNNLVTAGIHLVILAGVFATWRRRAALAKAARLAAAEDTARSADEAPAAT